MYNRILITGASGFVGTNLCNHLQGEYLPNRIKGRYNIIPCDSSNCDLRDIASVKSFLWHTRPDCIIHLAAKCGGIGANKDNPGLFMRTNL